MNAPVDSDVAQSQTDSSPANPVQPISDEDQTVEPTAETSLMRSSASLPARASAVGNQRQPKAGLWGETPQTQSDSQTAAKSGQSTEGAQKSDDRSSQQQKSIQKRAVQAPQSSNEQKKPVTAAQPGGSGSGSASSGSPANSANAPKILGVGPGPSVSQKQTEPVQSDSAKSKSSLLRGSSAQAPETRGACPVSNWATAPGKNSTSQWRVTDDGYDCTLHLSSGNIGQLPSTFGQPIQFYPWAGWYLSGVYTYTDYNGQMREPNNKQDSITRIQIEGDVTAEDTWVGMQWQSGGIWMHNEASLFAGMTALRTFDTSSGTLHVKGSGAGMFAWDNALTYPDFRGIDVSQATGLGNMFQDCRNLVYPNLSGWNMSNVTNLSGMFMRCYNLSDSGSWSNWYLPKCTSTFWMFWNAIV
ncbi:BspA family leucine-rich repeat surface protein [Bifidobacterium sp. ESL0682]|uniref:BspA family leucine-rich repeat surface protein n=1 Tax=Bifidobacterium sp. ESL0682 TaxID=2983212 RepID=UPI0023FA09BB|nr:BspA family leucine-rich repeat surface protein [Bifidobacterium sp. ESL0682]WEV42100.1 BspA family leucine-rich repeat surface protein [Bifidobacterium sp. ESL0682]